MGKPVFNQINLVCGNTEASLAFYRRLGVEIPDDAVWRTRTGAHHAGVRNPPGNETVNFELDSVAFARHWNESWKDRPDVSGRVVVGFHVPTRADVDAIFSDMTGAGYRGLQEPCDALWGARYAVLEDPDGIAVGLMSPVSPDKRSPPPDL